MEIRSHRRTSRRWIRLELTLQSRKHQPHRMTTRMKLQIQIVIIQIIYLFCAVVVLIISKPLYLWIITLVVTIFVALVIINWTILMTQPTMLIQIQVVMNTVSNIRHTKKKIHRYYSLLQSSKRRCKMSTLRKYPRLESDQKLLVYVRSCRKFKDVVELKLFFFNLLIILLNFFRY